MTDSASYTPLVLIVEGHEWTSLSFQSVLTQQDCAVFRAYTAQQGLDLLRRLIPDLVLVDENLPDMTGAQFLGQLKEVATVTPSVPRVVISVSGMSQGDRIAALANGAWDILTPPFDPVELELKAKTWIAIRRDGDKARELGMVDPLTGLYNLNGLLRRIDEISADASRNERDLTLVALGPSRHGLEGTEGDEADALSRALARTIAQIPRVSDAVARVGPAQFVIIAPGTDQDGAQVLVRRLLSSLADADLEAGFYSTHGLGKQPMNPMELLNRANEALRRAQAGNGSVHSGN